MMSFRLKRIVQIGGSHFIMFTLFRTKNNPKGPDIKRLQQLNFDLVGSRLKFSLPYSNDSSPERKHDVNQSIDIYDIDSFCLSELDDLYSNVNVLHRKSKDRDSLMTLRLSRLYAYFLI